MRHSDSDGIANAGPTFPREFVRQPYQRGVHGTPHQVQRLAQVAPSAAPETCTRGGVCKTAVATPVFGWLRPPNPLCTPIVASRVATACLPVKF
jgi:hypothetical protein